MIKFAQFGAGFIGKIHGANIAKHPRAELTYIYDVNTAAAEQLAAKLGAKVASSPEEIWASRCGCGIDRLLHQHPCGLVERRHSGGKTRLLRKTN